MNQSDMMQKMSGGNGFIAALDRSGRSAPKALKNYGIADGRWSNDGEKKSQHHRELQLRLAVRPPS
jgi:fructose-bisphosphate aldolase, class I